MPPIFWEELGRTVATFSQLEDILKRTIMSLPLTGFSEEEIGKKVNSIENMATGSLNRLINELKEIFKKLEIHPNPNLIKELEKAKDIRNIFTHGLWQPAENPGKAYPFLMKQKRLITDKNKMLYDAKKLLLIRTELREIIFDCICLVESNGQPFP